MKFLEKLDNLNQYISFNIFAICGWLYVPVLIWVFTFKHENYYTMFFYMPLFIFLLIPWLITTIALIIFLYESLTTKRLTNNFCVKNKYFRYFKNTGVMITLLFYLYMIFYCAILTLPTQSMGKWFCFRVNMVLLYAILKTT